MFNYLNKVHLILINGYVFFYTLAAFTTVYALQFPKTFYEANPFTALLFTQIGMAPTLVLVGFVTVAAMSFIPYLFKQSAWMGVILNSMIVAIVALDAGNNTFHLTKIPFLVFAHQCMTSLHVIFWGGI